MAFICYAYERATQVPYMEILAVASVEEARAKARRLLVERPHYTTAELWDGDTLISRLTREELISGRSAG